MSDDLLRQYCFRAARTLSVTREVYESLKRGDSAAAPNHVKRLELEVESWRDDWGQLEAYRVKVSEFHAAEAIWRHTGRIGQKPEMPEPPATLPPPDDIEYLFETISYLERSARQLRDTIDGTLLRGTLDDDLTILVSHMGFIGNAINSAQRQLERRESLNAAKNTQNDNNDSDDPRAPAVLDDLVTPSKQDSREKIRQQQPDNVDVRDLCKLLEKNRPQLRSGAKSEIGVAREYTREPAGECPKADNWLRQARRYPHLWK